MEHVNEKLKHRAYHSDIDVWDIWDINHSLGGFMFYVYQNQGSFSVFHAWNLVRGLGIGYPLIAWDDFFMRFFRIFRISHLES